jgi:5'-deoxynucleotidase YfbR-like HD superfamily hydrolase
MASHVQLAEAGGRDPRASSETAIRLYRGGYLDFRDPGASDFTIEDIAHGLANICRYAGQCRSFYSVAEHCVYVSAEAKGFELPALMHDAAEAFTGDITRPLKQLLPDFRRIEAAITDVISRRFGIPLPLPSQVKRAELRVFAAEQAAMMPPGTDEMVKRQGIQAASVTFHYYRPEEAEALFLERFRQLKR